MTRRVVLLLVLTAVLVFGACASRAAPQVAADDPPPDPPALERLEAMIAELKASPAWQPDPNIRPMQPRILGGTVRADGEPVARRGSKIAWVAGVVDANNAAPTRYDTSFDGAVFTPVGMATTVDVPDLGSGPHTFRVRSCNSEGCSDRDNPAAVGILGFTYANAVPAPPTGLQLVPPSTPIADAQQGADLIQAYWFLGTGGQKLNGRQLNAVVAQYNGVLPPTWGSALAFMDRIVWSGFAP